jgi:hypothetical protein
MLNTLQIIFLDLFNFDKKGSLSSLKKWELIQSEYYISSGNLQSTI